jgi:hypothetical protein
LTAATNRSTKVADYRTIPSLERILVVSATESSIKHDRGEGVRWKIFARVSVRRQRATGRPAVAAQSAAMRPPKSAVA